MILRGTITSDVLAMDTGVTVITPRNVWDEEPEVAYVLHGMYGNNGSWSDYSMLPGYARLYNVVFVMPEANRSFYADMVYGPKFFTYVADELPELCAKTFRLAAGRERTAIIGGSMGGNGAVKCALSRPERFGKCGAFASAALFLREFIEGARETDSLQSAMEGVGGQLVDDFTAILGDEFTVKRENDIPRLARDGAGETAKARFYSACGVDDSQFREENAAFAALMRRLGYDYTHEELPGDHHWPFFDLAIRRCLEFFYGDGSCVD